jgi:hypothetical protein
VSRIQAWRVQCGPARKRCEACSDEPAAHGGRCCYVCGGLQVICRQSEGCGVFDVDVYTARLCLCTWDACVGECSSPPLTYKIGPSAAGAHRADFNWLTSCSVPSAQLDFNLHVCQRRCTVLEDKVDCHFFILDTAALALQRHATPTLPP